MNTPGVVCKEDVSRICLHLGGVTDPIVDAMLAQTIA